MTRKGIKAEGKSNFTLKRFEKVALMLLFLIKHKQTRLVLILTDDIPAYMGSARRQEGGGASGGGGDICKIGGESTIFSYCSTERTDQTLRASETICSDFGDCSVGRPCSGTGLAFYLISFQATPFAGASPRSFV